MRTLFLDIDGVLNRESTKELSVTGFKGLDKYLVDKFLTWFNMEKDLDIVLSSTWRTDPVMVDEIRAVGIPLRGQTKVILNPGSRHIIRGEEINDFVVNNEIKKYAILDDTQDFFPQQLKYFVQTSYVHGLRDKDLLKLDKILM